MIIYKLKSDIMSRRSERRENKFGTKNSFYKRLCAFIVAIVVLAIINFIVSPGYMWVFWIALFGGLALLINFLYVFFLNDRFPDE